MGGDSLQDARDHARRECDRARTLIHRATGLVARSRDLCALLKTCGCGRTYRRATWPMLFLVGVLEGDEGESCELRQCHCGSTIAVLLPKLAPTP